MKPNQRKSGQGMVEFALILPVLLMVMLGIIEFGRLMFIYSVVTSASRDASRYGASIGPGPNGVPRYRECEAIRGRALSLGNLVGVNPGDVYITYDHGPGSAGLPVNCPDDVVLGDRVIVEVRGDYNPLPAAPLVGLLSFEFTSISRRTIIKDATIQQGGTAMGAIFTETPTITPTIDPLVTPSSTPVPTSTFTPGAPTTTPTFTPTPIPPQSPLLVSVQLTAFGQKCNDIRITWQPNPAWATYPGGAPTLYQAFKNGFYAAAVSPSDPANTVWVTNDQINDNSIITYTIVAVFSGPLQSEKLEKTYLCQNGTFIDISASPDVNVEIVVPGIDGVKITNLAQTAFEVQAWDTSVGTSNGDGIAEVIIEITGPGGTIIVNRSEFLARYCVFSGDGPCDQWDATASTPFLSAPDGDYVIRARARSISGIYTSLATRTFTLAKGPTIEFVVPGVDGFTVTDLSQTRFEVIAWDTAVGTNNGDGVADVFFEITGPGEIFVLGSSEAHLRYCVFKGHDPCDIWDGEASILFADAPNGTYTIKARALSDSGVSVLGLREHSLCP